MTHLRTAHTAAFLHATAPLFRIQSCPSQLHLFLLNSRWRWRSGPLEGWRWTPWRSRWWLPPMGGAEARWFRSLSLAQKAGYLFWLWERLTSPSPQEVPVVSVDPWFDLPNNEGKCHTERGVPVTIHRQSAKLNGVIWNLSLDLAESHECSSRLPVGSSLIKDLGKHVFKIVQRVTYQQVPCPLRRSPCLSSAGEIRNDIRYLRAVRQISGCVQLKVQSTLHKEGMTVIRVHGEPRRAG